MKPVIVFDLNGTLLDLSALDPAFAALFGDPLARKEWFAEVLKISLATTTRQAFADFSRITMAALKVVEQRRQRELQETQRFQLLQGLRRLPPFPDVPPGLEALQAAAYELVVLTNSGLEAAKEALEHAGIARHFARVLSADSAQRLKPSSAPYLMVAGALGVEPRSLMLVASHAWDVAGAMQAGCQACFLNRPGEVLDEIAPRPSLIASDLSDLSRQLARATRMGGSSLGSSLSFQVRGWNDVGR